MKILVYGFKPWKDLEKNISQEVLKKIKPNKNLKKIIFDVKFEKKEFINIIKRFKPETIIGIGMHKRGKKIRIERKAINILNKYDDKPKKKILKGKKELFVNLKIKKDNNSWISYNAGDYVCNYSMYVILNYIKDKNIKYGFIHIPKTYNINKAINFIKKRVLQNAVQ